MLHEEIKQYWDGRHKGYSQKNLKEFESRQDLKWKEEFQRCLPADPDIQILDIGTGPGFFPIILKQMGYGQVTAVDASEKMIAIAKENLALFGGDKPDAIRFEQVDAQGLAYEEASFDVIMMRNVTWNLEKPEESYDQWLRLLKPGGSMLIYDANWYSYLHDQEVRQQFERNLQQASEEALEDYWHGEGVDEARIEAIARQLPLTERQRPDWDVDYLSGYSNVTVEVDQDFGQKIWSREEELNYAATPMFALYIRKA